MPQTPHPTDIALTGKDRAMTRKDLPSPELLRKLLRYEPETGRLFWKPRCDGFANKRACSVWNKRFSGKEAGWKNDKGYVCINLSGKKLRAHRVAWAITHNIWPKDEIDHINGHPSDNRLENLREVRHSENGKNAKTPNTNKSGKVGIYMQKGTKSWRAEIKVNRKKIHLGYFKKFDEAVKARREAEEKYNFHANHGRA